MPAEPTQSGSRGSAYPCSDTSKDDDADPLAVASTEDFLQAFPVITHELAEALTAISAYLTGSRRMFESGDADRFDKMHGVLEQAHAQAMRANRSLRELRKAFSKVDRS